MKGLIKKGLVMVALVTATLASYGNEISKTVNDGKRVATNVTFKNVKHGAVLTIKDNNGLTFYKEKMESEGTYSKGFDLTALPNGQYYFELNGDVEIRVIPFSVSENVVAFNKTAEEKIFKPIVFVNGDKVHVSKMSVTDETMEVKMYFNGYDLAFIDTIEKEGNAFGKVYDFSTSEAGSYTVVIKCNGRKFVNEIEI